MHAIRHTHNNFKPENMKFADADQNIAKLVYFDSVLKINDVMAGYSPDYRDFETTDVGTSSIANDIWVFGLSIGRIEMNENTKSTNRRKQDRLGCFGRKRIDNIKKKFGTKFLRIFGDSFGPNGLEAFLLPS